MPDGQPVRLQGRYLCRATPTIPPVERCLTHVNSNAQGRAAKPIIAQYQYPNSQSMIRMHLRCKLRANSSMWLLSWLLLLQCLLLQCLLLPSASRSHCTLILQMVCWSTNPLALHNRREAQARNFCGHVHVNVHLFLDDILAQMQWTTCIPLWTASIV